MIHRTDDLRIQSLRPLLPPAILMEEVPASAEDTALVALSREAAARILHGQDDRLLVVVGPCSIQTRERPWSTRGSCARRRSPSARTCSW
jgi:3-deoxy-7-phosphoheptulonate synthase